MGGDVGLGAPWVSGARRGGDGDEARHVKAVSRSGGGETGQVCQSLLGQERPRGEGTDPFTYSVCVLEGVLVGARATDEVAL